jgi:lincosamide nucleotidyltransferase A/C/D/E
VAETTSRDVVTFLSQQDALGVHVWIDGGWAVDACLGRQTRSHADLDIVIEEIDLGKAVAALRSRGYREVPRDDTRPWNFVLGDAAGHEVDFHVIVRDAAGNGVYGPPQNGEVYPADALSGRGTIEDRAVDCISPEWLVRFHTGYDLKAKDWADVSALCKAFGIPIPAEYERFR